ncbi:MAG: hypothetical protein WBF06_10620, partial [Candidatus Acidiferrales bacterium]
YESSRSSPVAVDAGLTVNKVAPEILVGIGNLVPRGRDRRRWGIDFEGGVAFQGSPDVSLDLSGFACTPPNSEGPTCANTVTSPSIQASVLAQETKLDHKLSILKFYPVLSLGISYSF